MKKFFCIIFFIFIFFTVANGDDSQILKTGIVIEENVPDVFFGEWRVSAKLLETNSAINFKTNNIDLWNISRNKSVITLENPFSGAKADVTIREVVGNKIIFEKESKSDNQTLHDKVEITLDSDNFIGTNYLVLTTYSELDGHEMTKKFAKYSLIGDKISGENIFIEE